MDQAVTSKIELKSRTLPILVGIVLLLQLFGAYKGWMILLVGLGGAWLLGYLWARSLAKGLNITREKRYAWAKVGDLMLERFYLENSGWAAALWVVVKDHSTLPGYIGDKVTSVEGRSSKTWIKRNYCNLRGLYTIGPTSLHTGDPLGFYRVIINCSPSEMVLVMPPVVDLPKISIAVGERRGDGRAQVSIHERSVSSASIREYMAGDSLHSIHWARSAQHDDLFVRIFDSTHSSDWWIILDMDQEVHVGKNESSTEEYAIVLAASLADRGRSSGHSFGIVAYGEKPTWLPPTFGSVQYWNIMQELAILKPGTTSFSTVLARTQPQLGQRTSAILITPAVGGNWLNSLVSMMNRGIAVTVLLLDNKAFGGTQELDKTFATLEAWGVNLYRVTPNTIKMPTPQTGQEELHSPLTSLNSFTQPNGHDRDSRWNKISG